MLTVRLDDPVQRAGAKAAATATDPPAALLSTKRGFATFLDPCGGRPASAGLGALLSTRQRSRLAVAGRAWLDRRNSGKAAEVTVADRHPLEEGARP